MIKSIEEIYIYESPDGGKTVYRRLSGSPTAREMVREDPECQYIEQWNYWRDILKTAKNNTTLSDAIHKAEMIYNLIKNQSI